MGDYLIKLRFLFFPAVLFAAAMIVAYLTAYALLVEWTGWLAMDGELQEFWIPFVFGGCAMLAFLGPRLRIYEKSDKRDPGGLVIFVAMLLIVPPVMLLQYSLQEAMWGLRTVSSLNDVPLASNARFYTTHGDCVNLPGTRWYGFAHNDGRHNDVKIELYAAVPVCAAQAGPARWIGVHRTHTISGSTSKDAREAEANSFERKMHSDVESLDALQFSYYERVRAGSERHQFEKAIGKSVAGMVIVTPQREAFGARTTARLTWAAIAFGIGTALCAFVLLFWRLDEAEVESVRQTGRLSPKPKEEFSLWALVVPSRYIYGPAVLIDVIAGVFFAMVFSGLGVMSFLADDLLAWGANHGPLGFGPDNYGLVTAMFLHGGLWHMVNNLYGLLFAIVCLLPVARNSRLILCFLICGVAGSIASVWWNPHVVGVGASGAVLGLWGVAVALAALRDHRVAGNEKFILTNVAIYGVMTALLGLVAPNIDNAAHIGGFATGLIVGTVLFFWEKVSPDPEADDRYQDLVMNYIRPTGRPVR